LAGIPPAISGPLGESTPAGLWGVGEVIIGVLGERALAAEGGGWRPARKAFRRAWMSCAALSPPRLENVDAVAVAVAGEGPRPAFTLPSGVVVKRLMLDFSVTLSEAERGERRGGESERWAVAALRGSVEEGSSVGEVTAESPAAAPACCCAASVIVLS